MNDIRLGSTTLGTTFPDIIINTVEGTATSRIAGFAQIVHNPAELKTVVDALNQQEIPSVFADAVLLRRQVLQQLDDTWDFPLASAVPNTCPLPWTIIEATEKAALTGNSVEYNIMRTLDFIGRNILRLELPAISLFQTNYQMISNLTDVREQAQNMYLGAWYRDLIPRIVKSISLYPRSASHDLFVYSGYDIYIHNLIFGNERKEMNDLMSGEDRFELCYDPYRVDGSALGLNSFKGMDVYSAYSITNTSMSGFNASQRVFNQSTSNASTPGQDTLIDYFQRDDFMDIEEFNDCYRKNVWYEAPIAQNYHSRHSIHSRRVIHYAKSINVPLDILPFSYSLSSALSTAALAGECGYIRVELYSDWLSRAFYCTKISNIAPSHPLVNHLHFQLGDTYKAYNQAGVEQIVTIGEDNENQLIGWVNARSIGRFGDSEFVRNSADDSGNNFNTVNAYSIEGNVLGLNAAAHKENVIGGKTEFVEGNTRATFVPPNSSANATLRTGNSNQVLNVHNGTGYVNAGASYLGVNGSYVTTGTGYGSQFMAPTLGAGSSTVHSRIQRNPASNYGVIQANVSTTATVDVSELLTNVLAEKGYASTPIVHPLIVINPSYDAEVRSSIKVRLFQIGFQTLQSVSELLTKLPNIYITTEWSDMDVPVSNPTSNLSFRINNDLYQMANVFWFIPKDNYGVESMRLYACHKINHEMPLINVLRMKTQLDQGASTYDWDMLNLVNPAYMGLNPLLENIGIISFAPEIHSNSYPLAYFDPNISGQIEGTFELGSNIEQNLLGADRYSVNMKKGTLKIITLGINGVVSVNLNLFRLVF